MPIINLKPQFDSKQLVKFVLYVDLCIFEYFGLQCFGGLNEEIGRFLAGMSKLTETVYLRYNRMREKAPVKVWFGRLKYQFPLNRETVNKLRVTFTNIIGQWHQGRQYQRLVDLRKTNLKDITKTFVARKWNLMR